MATNLFAARELFVKWTMGIAAVALFTITRGWSWIASILDYNLFGTELLKVSNLIAFALVAGIIWIHNKTMHV